MHPAGPVDRLGGLLRLVPVAEHHRVAAGAQLARLAAGQRQPGLRVDDLDLDVRVHPADRGHPQVQRVVGPGLGGHRRGLGHPVADRHLGHAHPVHDLLHHLHRARRAGHDPGAQRGQVVVVEVRVVELGDEHRRHPVERGAALAGHRVQGGLRVEARPGDDHGGAVGGAAQVAHHHAEAVVEGHRDADPVVRGVAAQPADEVAVVQDVVVATAWRPWGSRWCPRCTGC